MKIYGENKSIINIACNSLQHNKIRHLEIDIHFFKKNKSGFICLFVLCHKNSTCQYIHPRALQPYIPKYYKQTWNGNSILSSLKGCWKVNVPIKVYRIVGKGKKMGFMELLSKYLKKKTPHDAHVQEKKECHKLLSIDNSYKG